jgi:hypothetical protein
MVLGRSTVLDHSQGFVGVLGGVGDHSEEVGGTDVE